MALVVRNTFIHVSQQDANQPSDGSQNRSSSAPPTCRQTKREDDSPAVSTTCDTPEIDFSTITSDIDDAASQSSHEYEDVSPSMSCCNSDDEDNEQRAKLTEKALTTHERLEAEAAQNKIDEMAQKVMDLWATLRMLESQVEGQSAEAQSTAVSATSHEQVCQQCENISEVQHVLASARQSLVCIPGVASIESNFGPAGTMATLAVKLSSSDLKQSVVAAAKAMLLDIAAGSASTYVFGYQRQPFQDYPDGSGFALTLASMPDENTACWTMYQKGFCPRRTCKWQHPGRNELQPVRVVVM